MNRIKAMKKIVEFYGEREQFTQLMEECCELAIAINKWRRKTTITNYDNIIEEIADVEIMVDQIKMILNIDDCDINRLKDFKLTRTLARIEDEKKQDDKFTIDYLQGIKNSLKECKDCGFCWNQKPEVPEITEIIDELIKLKRGEK